ncbi:MAG: SEC-C metal-binding domain-containing protein [Chloroflexota bacterium]
MDWILASLNHQEKLDAAYRNDFIACYTDFGGRHGRRWHPDSGCLWPLGWLLNHVMHLDPFQVTVLSLAGMLAFGSLATRIFQTIMDTMPRPSAADDDDEDDEEEDDEEFEVEDVDEEPVIYPSIPRRRQPLKTPDFSNTRPADRCPCGSGRKYKNCHGAKRPAA